MVEAENLDLVPDVTDFQDVGDLGHLVGAWRDVPGGPELFFELFCFKGFPEFGPKKAACEPWRCAG